MRLAAENYATDKSANPDYLRNYEEFLAPLVDQEVKLLEIGIFKGGSLQMWRDYLPKATIVGLDVEPVEIDDPSGRIRIYQGEEQDTELLDRIAAENAPDGFDVIIDDSSCVGQYARICFWHMFENHLKPGGIYFIDHWPVSYWRARPDGKRYRPPKPDFATHEKVLNWLHKRPSVQRSALLRKLVGAARYRLVKKRFPSHARGMVGFVKELVDEPAMSVITHPEFGIGPHRPSRFESMRICRSQVVIVKASGEQRVEEMPAHLDPDVGRVRPDLVGDGERSS